MAYKNRDKVRKKRVNLYFSKAEMQRAQEFSSLYEDKECAALLREKVLWIADQELEWFKLFGREKAEKMLEHLAKLAKEEVERAELCERLAGLARERVKNGEDVIKG